MLAQTVITEPHHGLLLAATVVAVTTAATAVLAHLLTRGRSARPGEPTMDLGAEPPAVVSLLVGEGEPDPDAVAATILDLAARRHLDVELAGAGAVLIRMRPPAADPMRPYELRLLDPMRRRASDGLLPAPALATGSDRAAEAAWRTFRRAVVAEAQAGGLCRDRYGRPLVAGLGLAAVAVMLLVFAAISAGDERVVVSGERLPLAPSAWAVAVIALGAALLAWSSHLTRRRYQRLTDTGRVAAGRWLGVHDALAEQADFADEPAPSVAIWDRQLAYAAALGLARQAVRDLPTGAERHRHAWSHYGNRWRRVTIRYVKLRPGWGQHPVAAVVSGMLVVVAAVVAVRVVLGVLLDDTSLLAGLPDPGRRWAERAAVGVALGLSGIALIGAAKVVLGLLDVPALLARREVTGVVIRHRRFLSGHWLPDAVEAVAYSGRSTSRRQRHERRYVALDTGTTDVVRAWKVRPSIFAATWQDGEARVEVTPLLGYVRAAEMCSAPPVT